MAQSFVQLPDDSANVGKKVATRTRVQGSDTVHDHVFAVNEILTPLPAGNNNIGDVDVASMPGQAAPSASVPAAVIVTGGVDDSGQVKMVRIASDIFAGAAAGSVAVAGQKADGTLIPFAVGSGGELAIAGLSGSTSIAINVAPNGGLVPASYPLNAEFSSPGDFLEIDPTPNGGVKYYSLQVTANGAVTSWSVVLEVTLDDSSFTPILTHTNVTGSGVTIAYSGVFPAFSFRVRCSAITLGPGTSLFVTAFATA